MIPNTELKETHVSSTLNTFGTFVDARFIRTDVEIVEVWFLKTDGVDAEWLHILAIGVTLAGAEVREDLGGEFLPVGVEPGHVVCVIENEQTFGVVQENPHLLQLALDVEAGPGLGAGAVLIPIVHNDAVKAAAGLDLDAAFAADRLVGHADHPLRLLRYHHLPVMHAWREALCSQHGHLHIKAARGVLQRLRVEVPVRHNGAVVREDQSLVGCDGVEGQCSWHCKGEGKQGRF